MTSLPLGMTFRIMTEDIITFLRGGWIVAHSLQAAPAVSDTAQVTNML